MTALKLLEKKGKLYFLSKIIIRRKNDLFCSQRDKYKLQLDRALHKIEHLRSNAQMAESQCRELDSALTNARRECSELRAVEAKYSVTACNFGSYHV